METQKDVTSQQQKKALYYASYYQRNAEKIKERARKKYDETKDSRIKTLYCPELEIIVVYSDSD